MQKIEKHSVLKYLQEPAKISEYHCYVNFQQKHYNPVKFVNFLRRKTGVLF